jgi:lipoprotein
MSRQNICAGALHIILFMACRPVSRFSQIFKNEPYLPASVRMVSLPLSPFVHMVMELFITAYPATQFTHGVSRREIRAIQPGKVSFQIGLDNKLFFIYNHTVSDIGFTTQI